MLRYIEFSGVRLGYVNFVVLGYLALDCIKLIKVRLR
jgi:hypothetical protein